MAKSKTDLIRDYLASNPDATGKQAEASLKKHGISAQYFYTIKSNLAKRGNKSKTKKKAAGKKVRRTVRRASAQPSFEELQSVADFARDFGGLDKLSDAVTALRQFQLQSN